MSVLYITDEQLKLFAVANESDTTEVWELLVEAVSRLFDRECEVSDGFFGIASNAATERAFDSNGTKFLQLLPYIPDSISSVVVDTEDIFEIVSTNRTYKEKDGYLIFDIEPDESESITITARWGFAVVPFDIQMACIEQALLMWRRKDLTFADMSGVAGSVVTAEFSPSFIASTKRYREIYSSNNYFS